MEVYTMVTNGEANLGEPVSEVLTRPPERRFSLRRKCAVQILDEDGTFRLFETIKEAARVLGLRGVVYCTDGLHLVRQELYIEQKRTTHYISRTCLVRRTITRLEKVHHYHQWVSLNLRA